MTGRQTSGEACKPGGEPLLFFVSMPDFSPEALVMGFIWYAAFLFSTTCHEASHALIAKLGGDDTAAQQVTLNPVPHIQREPFGMVVIPILALLANGWVVGWASAPFDPHWQQRHPRRAALMAWAGPAANFFLMLVAALALRIGVHYGWIDSRIGLNTPTTGAVLFVFFELNLLLGTFNMLPFSPLDGSTGITLFMSERASLRYLNWLRGNSFAIAGLLIALVLFRKIFPHIESFARQIFLNG
jgi:Zn-dependent protease